MKEFFWPSIGWVRAFRYAKHRVLRLSDSTHKIAVGLACGVSVSFTPLVGTHFIQAGLFSYVLNGNFLSSLIGTFVGNPWTFPFMWWAAIKLGSLLFSLFAVSATTVLPAHMDFAMLWHIIWHEPLRLFLPWLVGGYLMAMLTWPLSYFIFYNLVRGAKLARQRARMHRIHRVAKEVTGQKV